MSHSPSGQEGPGVRHTARLRHPRFKSLALMMAAGGLISPTAHAGSATADNAALIELRKQIDDMRQQYEARLKDLEGKLTQLQQQQAATNAQAAATPASPPAPSSESTASNATGAPASDNSFNPSVAVILSGMYASLSKDPNTGKLSGFVPSDSDTSKRGFNLSESELSLSANIDPWFYGALTLSVSPDDTISAEEAFVQTTALPEGLKIKAGRVFSGLGYLNEQHSHTWDFVDAPLAYQAFLGGQYKQEGLQAKWLLPTDQFIELTGELGNGHGFPGNDRNRNGAGSTVLAAHTGGDVGDSNSWRAGLSWMRTEASNRTWEDAQQSAITNAFTGQSRIWALDGVWKWAPNGNATQTNFKLQGEYFRRVESGDVVYDTTGVASPGNYRSAQSGWYLQGIYQFTRGWRVGLRHDQLDSGSVDYGNNAINFIATDYKPQRDSVMLDWSPSEFSRIRLQLNNDRSRVGVNDRQLFLQYQMSLGAHGAHSY